MGEYAKESDNQSRALHGNPRASKQASADVILQQYKERCMQRYATEKDEELVQNKSESALSKEQESVQREVKPNNTGLPDNLKTRVENLSGYSMDDVNVHYNSPKPAQLQALAYTQGTDIHVAPGQEKHLPHEAWHVVQQKQGRVQPTMQMKGVNVNDDEELEREADLYKEKTFNSFQEERESILFSNNSPSTIQRVRTDNKPESTPLTPEAEKIREHENKKDLNESKIWSEAIFSGEKIYIKESFDGITVKARKVDSKVIFVLGTDNIIYIRQEPHGRSRQDEFTHANFLSGLDVKTAGQMFVRDGIITRIDNESGHYKPKDVTLEWILDVLRDKVDLSKIMLVMVSSGGIKAYNAFEYDTEAIEKMLLLEDNTVTDDEEFQTIYDSEKTEYTLRYFEDKQAYHNHRDSIIKLMKAKRRCTLIFSFKNRNDFFNDIWKDVLNDINYTYLMGYPKIKVSDPISKSAGIMMKYSVKLAFLMKDLS